MHELSYRLAAAQIRDAVRQGQVCKTIWYSYGSSVHCSNREGDSGLRREEERTWLTAACESWKERPGKELIVPPAGGRWCGPLLAAGQPTVRG